MGNCLVSNCLVSNCHGIGKEGPKNCGCAVLSEFSLEELAIVGNVQCEKLDPPHLSLIKHFTVYCLFKG